MQLNSFARGALSQLTLTFNAQLYEDFLDAWRTHVTTKSMIDRMSEEKARMKRCLIVFGDDTITLYIPFPNQNAINADCCYYADRVRVISKRSLGGNVELGNENDWKSTQAHDLALLEILEMVPWYDFISDDAIKENLRTPSRCFSS